MLTPSRKLPRMRWTSTDANRRKSRSRCKTALRAERDAAQKAAEDAERDRDAWNEKCTEARDTLVERERRNSLSS